MKLEWVVREAGKTSIVIREESRKTHEGPPGGMYVRVDDSG